MSHLHAERRSQAYTFKTLRELMAYYADLLPVGRIEQCIRECALHFSVRRDATREEERLQFIRRCESAIQADLALLQEAFARKAAPAKTTKSAKPVKSGKEP